MHVLQNMLNIYLGENSLQKQGFKCDKNKTKHLTLIMDSVALQSACGCML